MLKKYKWIVIALILILLSSVSAQAANTLVLPAGTTEIHAQAFYGDTAIGEVKLPEGLLRIESQAFAASSVTKINLPASLTFIAEDAFENCNRLEHVTVQAGTYAYTRAHEIGLFDLRALISGSVKEAVAGESIVWTAKAMNGVSPYKYLFEVYRDGEKIDSRAYTAEDSYTYQFTRAGEYYAIAKIKDDDGNVASAKSAIVTVTANTPVIESVNCNLSEIKTAEEVRWTVSAKKGTAPYAYAFALNKGDALIAESENSTGEYSFTFETAGDYILSVTVTDAYQESASCILPLSVSLTPVSIQNISCSHETLVAETAISWTVNATAGAKPYAYSYEILSGSEVIFAAADQTANTCSYTFENAGEYTLSVAVTDAEGNTATSTRALSVAPRALEIVSVDYDQIVELGNALTWTVNAVGGDKPLRYAFDLYKDGEEIDGAAFTESKSFTFTPNAAGKYSVRIRVRDQRNTTVEMTGCETHVYIATAEEYFTYYVYSEKANVTGYTGTETEVYIPSILGGYPVARINSYAFDNCRSLTSVVIPEGVTDIGNAAFRNCTGLENVTIPESVKNIESNAFYACSSLKSVVIPEGVTDIRYMLFYKCSSLTSVTIPDSVTSIFDDAFRDCSSLMDVTIPDGVTSIGNRVFWNCSSLKSMTIPGGVASISDTLFSNCISLENVNILEGVASIGSGAFGNCTNLKSVTIPESVTSIGSAAFAHCESLASVTIPEGVTIIDDSVFESCSSLTSVTIPEGVTSIGPQAFYECSSLASVTIPEGVTTIGYSAFENCSSLESVTIPDSVTSIGSCAFLLCNSLENVYAESLEGWLNIAFSFVSNPMEYADNLYIGGELLTKVVIPDGVTNIGPYVFNNCDRLTSVTIPGSVASIGEYAFNSCDNLMNVTLNEGLKTIGKYAFSNCGLLMNVTLPSGLEKVESCAFSACYSLTNVYGPDLQDWLHIEFVDAVSNPMYSAKNLYLEGKPLAVTQVTWPEELDKIGNYTFCNWTSLESIIIPQSVTSIGDGAFDGCEKLSSLNLPDGITSIGKSAFDGCKKLTNLTLPANLTSIGSYAFNSCTSLTEITIPAGVTAIEACVFSSCSLRQIELPDNITSIGDGAFMMNELTEITIPSKVQSIGTQAFAVCEELTKVIIPESVQQIGRQAFMYCISLSEIYIPESVISIGAAAFEDCENLTVFCYEGSYTHTYCVNHSIKYQLITD